MIECQKLWTHECFDPEIGTKMEEGYCPKYMNLRGPQYLQIFRTRIDTNADELYDGRWVDKAKDVLDRHYHAINEYLNKSKGMIIDSVTGTRIVGEGSGPVNPGIRPIRIMHGIRSFEDRPDFDLEWRPGLLHLKSRMLKVMKPWAPMDHITGADMEFVRESCWMSEVALGFRDDGRWHWEPYRMADAAEGWLEEIATWGHDDFPR